MPPVVKCRNCGNSGLDAFRNPCFCNHGRRIRASVVPARPQPASVCEELLLVEEPPDPGPAPALDRGGGAAETVLVAAPPAESPSHPAALSQRELCDLITGEILQGLFRLGVTGKRQDPPDLSPVLRGIEEKHSEVLLAIERMRVPVAEAPPQSKPKRSRSSPPLSLQAAAAAAAASEDEEGGEPARAAAAGSPPPAGEELRPLQRMISGLRAEVRRTSEELRRDVAASREDLLRRLEEAAEAQRRQLELRTVEAQEEGEEEQTRLLTDAAAAAAAAAAVPTAAAAPAAEELRQELASVRRELRDSRKGMRADSEVLLGELHCLPKVLGDIKQAIRKLDQKAGDHHAEVLQAATAAKAQEVDHRAIATHLIEGLREVELGADLAGVGQELRALREEIGGRVASAVESVVKKQLFGGGALLKVDNSEVLSALGGVGRLEPDVLSSIADAVHERLGKGKPRADNADVLQALRRLKSELQPETIADEVHKRIAEAGLLTDRTAIVEAIKNNTAAPDLSPILAAIRAVEVDFSPVMEGLHALASRIGDEGTCRHAPATHSDHAAVMRAIRKLHSDIPDVAPIFAAIDAVGMNLAPIGEAIQRIDSNSDHAGILEAIERFHVPDYGVIANVVSDRVCSKDLATQSGQNEVLQAIRQIKVDKVDLSPIINAIDAAEVNLTPVMDALDKILSLENGKRGDVVGNTSALVQRIATAVDDKISRPKLNIDEGDLLQQIQKLKMEVNFEPVITAIGAVKADVLKMLRAVTRIEARDRTMVATPLPSPRFASQVCVLAHDAVDPGSAEEEEGKECSDSVAAEGAAASLPPEGEEGREVREEEAEEAAAAGARPSPPPLPPPPSRHRAAAADAAARSRLPPRSALRRTEATEEASGRRPFRPSRRLSWGREQVSTFVCDGYD